MPRGGRPQGRGKDRAPGRRAARRARHEVGPAGAHQVHLAVAVEVAHQTFELGPAVPVRVEGPGALRLATAGMLVMALGLFGLSGLGEAGSQTEVVTWLAVVGLGTGIFISPNSSALMGAAPRHQQGTAGSVLAESRILGMMIGVAVATAVFRAAGGQTGATWRPVDFEGFRRAELSAAGAALFGALAASLRGAGGSGQVERS